MIVIPNATEMKKVADIEQQWLAIEYEQKILKGWQSVDELIAYIAQRIYMASASGQYCIEFDIADNRYDEAKLDHRISFYYQGYFTYEMAEYVEQIFKKCGYNARVCHLIKANNKCYRSGSVYVSWT